MKNAIFFDLDGTLWDAIDNLTIAWNIAMEENHLPYRFTKEMIRSYMGLTPMETVKLAFKDVAKDVGLKYFDLCFQKELKYLKINPGNLYENEEKVLNELAKTYHLYIVSNCNQGYIENYLYSCHMERYFKGKLCTGDTKKDKAENILLLKEREGIDNVIYVGDTFKDFSESNKAGVDFIFAAYGFGNIENPPYKIENLCELIKLVDKIFKNKSK